MRKGFFLLLLLGAGQVVLCQDLLYKAGERNPEEVKMLEVSEVFVKYKRSNHSDGPVYTYPKKRIDSILYANGRAEYFSVGKRHRPISPEKARRQQTYSNLKPNLWVAGLGVHDVVNPEPMNRLPMGFKNQPALIFLLSYERSFLKDRLGIELAPFLGLNSTTYGSSFGVRFYPKKLNRVRVGFGPQYVYSVKAATLGYFTKESGRYVTVWQKMAFSTLALTWKVNINLDPKWSVNANLAAGGIVGAKVLKNRLPQDWKFEKSFFYYNASLGLGLRF